MLDSVAQAIVHSFIAALTVEALLRLWVVTDSSLRYTLRLLSLVLPLALVPLFAWLAPARAGEIFRADWALFVGRHWSGVRLFGVSLHGVFVTVLCGLGFVLFLRDLVPLVDELLVGRDSEPEPAIAPPRVRELVLNLSAEAHVRAPPVGVIDRRTPMILCRGAIAPRLLVSQPALDQLDDEELRAALAHELAHLRHADPLVGWLVLALRALACFNPVTQVVARLLAREAEWRADDDASAATRTPEALASSLLKLYRASLPARRPARRGLVASLDSPLLRAGTAAITTRCRRLLDGDARPAVWPRTRLALTALSLSALLFFVV